MLRSLLAVPELRAFVLAAACASLAEGGFTVLLGVHVYELTHNAFALGWLGLAEAAPAIGLVLLGGHVADRVKRRSITAVARLALACVALVVVFGFASGGLPLLYGVAFVAASFRAFEDPAASGLEAQILPRQNLLNAVSLIASASRIAGLLGPLLAGLAYAAWGPIPVYGVVAVLHVISALTIRFGIADRPVALHSGESAFRAIGAGLRYVFSSQVIVGSMALDLFAVFFGGVTGLLPVFAVDILHGGPAAVGLLRAAASAGSLGSMLVATRHPPRARAGAVLHLAVAGFGLGIIVFGLSRNLYLSLAALAFAGACDGISVVIRRVIVRIAAPDGVRGRVAAVRGLFVNASNELGTFESGIAAGLLGAVPAVWLGGAVTLAVVGLTAWRAPKLRRLDLRRIAAG